MLNDCGIYWEFDINMIISKLSGMKTWPNLTQDIKDLTKRPWVYVYDICSLDHEAFLDLIKSKFQPFMKLQLVIST